MQCGTKWPVSPASMTTQIPEQQKDVGSKRIEVLANYLDFFNWYIH